MLSIVVNDALLGIDIAKNYPALYARMLGDEELRTAFLDCLELLEQSRAGELPDYAGPDTINLDFLHQASSKPTVRSEGRLDLLWHLTAEQLQTKFSQAASHPDQDCCPADSFLDESPVNLLHYHIETNDQHLTLRLDAVPVATNPEYLNLVLAIFPPTGTMPQFEATLAWSEFRHTVEVNKFGLARFPPLETVQGFSPTGQPIHDLELCLVQSN